MLMVFVTFVYIYNTRGVIFHTQFFSFINKRVCFIQWYIKCNLMHLFQLFVSHAHQYTSVEEIFVCYKQKKLEVIDDKKRKICFNISLMNSDSVRVSSDSDSMEIFS